MTLRMSPSRLLPLAAALLLAACATPRPPEAAAPPRLPAAWLTPAEAGAPALAPAWWQGLGDPALAGLVERAWVQSPTLAQARARLALAQAQRQSAQAALGPRLQTQLAPSRGQMAPPLQPSSSATWTLQAGWELDLFGAARASRDAAGARAEAAALTLDHARQTLAVEVAQALLAWRHADAQLALARSDEALAEQLARADADAARAGTLSPAQAALGQTLAAAARTATQLWVEQRGAWLQTLALLVADDAAALAGTLDAQPLPAAPALAVDVLPAALLERRADLAAALRQWQAAALEARGTAIAQYAPQLSFSALVGRGRWELGGSSTTGTIWSLAPTLSIPLFDGGGRAAATAAARAQEDEARAGLEAQWRGAVAEVEQALLRWHAASARRREAEATLGHWQRIADASRAQARAGLVSGQALARDERNALAVRSDALDAAREHAAAYLQLIRALGGGWTNPSN
jgi:NodT family efflux transporter outer membrane factor (OMF) lipoprotein